MADPIDRAVLGDDPNPPTAQPRRSSGWLGYLSGRVEVAEIHAVTEAMPTWHRPPVVRGIIGGPDQRRRAALPLPPRRERPPELLANERGVALYGSRQGDRGAYIASRIVTGQAAGRIETDFAISSVIVQNLSTSTIVVGLGDIDPALNNAVVVCGPNRLVSVPTGGGRIVRFATLSGANLAAGEVAIVQATDAQLAAAAGALA